MPKIIFIEANGTEHSVEGDLGQSVMAVAMHDMVPGRAADCGGNGSCATYHGYIDATWQDNIPAPSSDEEMMLEMARSNTDSSRLTCQISLSEALDGLVVRWPQEQSIRHSAFSAVESLNLFTLSN